MITVFTGSPGAGKTASLVDFLTTLPGDRPLYVDGLEGLTLPHTVVDASNWPTELPDGAILVVDEAQRVWRPRGAGSKVPASIAEMETHRHRGIDIFLTTQSPALLDSNLRGLVGRHVHIRDTGVLGRYWYEWPECNLGMTWKTCVNKRRFSLPKKAFSLYKSSSMHTTPVRGFPKALIVLFVAVVAIAVLGGWAYFKKSKVAAPLVVQSAPPGQVGAAPLVPAIAEAPYIDDRVAFIPRVSYRPESAPAYDHLRSIVAMPVVAGGVCMGAKCKCYTQQGTDAGLTPSECREWIANTPFDNYRPSPDKQAAHDDRVATSVNPV